MNEIHVYAVGVCINLLKINPHVVITPSKEVLNVMGEQATRILDIFVEGYGKAATIEVKWSFPRKVGTEQYTRAVAQVKSAVSAPDTGEVVFWTLKAPRSGPELMRFKEALGDDANKVKILSGVSDLFTWYVDYFKHNE